MNSNKRTRVAITGLGTVSPIGIGLEAFWNGLESGKSGTRLITSFDVSKYRCHVGAQITNFEPTEYIDEAKADRIDRYSQLGIAAAKMALEDAAIFGNSDVGVYTGTGLGGMFWYEKSFVALQNGGPKAIHPIAVPQSMPNSVAAHTAMELKLRGPNISISTACSSSLHAIGLGFDAIRFGRAKTVLAGGSESSLTPLTFGAFDAMRIMSTAGNSDPARACRPFDKNRDGMVLGEGSAMLMLEDYDQALKRKASIYGEIIGYAANCGAYHIVTPDPTAKDVISTMIEALTDSGIAASEIDYINAHATATQLNDQAETVAIKSVFGKDIEKVSISCTKSMIGHTIGAAGAFGVLAALLAINKSIIHPTINYSTKDEACDLNVTPNVRAKRKVKTAMINAFGFGSNNACLVLRSPR